MIVKQFPSRLGQYVLSSSDIRSRFLNYFKSKSHVQIKSSSVLPHSDPTLEFVNAGMNQFKNVFLGLSSAPVNRAVNSQKCIRVGGKHNDLNIVGHDSYHHTFFEMLGNWSFGDYFKREACEYALELITSSPYSLPLERLYFTYFHGDTALNLPPDLETLEIWQSLGIKDERILGFGLKENFWEMGSSGPCGPCTEIHYDHTSSEVRAHLVNKDLPDLTELWNIVFIQFNRHEDGSLSELNKSYVDTGMGLERLVALLQGKSSNYDTDLFYPLFHTIQKHCNVPPYGGSYGKNDVNNVDTMYRILADHSRMIAVSLSDYILPDYSHSLRRVIRKSLLVANSLSPDSGLPLLLEVVNSASESLKDHFPDIYSNIDQIEIILKDEDKLFKDVQKETVKEWNKLREKDNSLDLLVDSQSVGLIEAYKYLKRNNNDSIAPLDTEKALTCYDRYGLSFSLIEQLAQIKGYTVNRCDFEKAIIKLKETNKSNMSNSAKVEKSVVSFRNIEPTNDRFKFSYSRNPDTQNYSFDVLDTEVTQCWLGNHSLKKGQQIKNRSNVSVVLLSTNFHSPMKNCSLGRIKLVASSGLEVFLDVDEAERLHGWIIHKGIISSPSLGPDDMLVYEDWNAKCFVNESSYLSMMQNSTGAMLFDFVLRSRYKVSMTYLNINSSHFTAKFNLYTQPFGVKDALHCEEEVKNLINDKEEIRRQILSAEELLSNSNITIPPYLNPSLMCYQYLSSLDSKPLNCVTSHPVVLNTGDIVDLCLTKFHLSKRNRECTISGVTGSDIKNNMFVPSRQLLETFNQHVHNQDEVANFAKDVKNKIYNNKIPLSLQDEITKAIENNKLPFKQVKSKSKK